MSGSWLPSIPQTILDWVLVIGAAGALATAISTSWLSYVTWRPPLRKAKARVFVQQSGSAGDRMRLLLHSKGRVDLNVLEVGFSFGYKTYAFLPLEPVEQEHGHLTISPGGWKEQEYRLPPASDTNFGTMSRWGLYGLKFRIDTPNGFVFVKIRGKDYGWVAKELRKRADCWKTETFLEELKEEGDDD